QRQVDGRPQGSVTAPAPTPPSLGYCLAQLRGGAEPGLGRALLALRTRHIKQPGGIERFRARGGLGPLLGLLAGAIRPRRTLDLALSILGNLMILKSLGVESIHNRTARALGNLAIDVENLQAIHDAGAVPPLVQVLASSQDSECLQSVIRALRNLGATPVHRLALAQQGAVRVISERLAASPDDPALAAAAARALLELTKAWGVGVAPLVALAGHSKRAVRRRPSRHCPSLPAGHAAAPRWVRWGRGSAGGGDPAQARGGSRRSRPAAPGQALCLLCREAMNRSRVREAGGLELLLALAADGRQRGCHARVVVAFVAFFYDQEALEVLQAGGLVALLVERLVEEEGESEDERDAASFDFPPEGRRESGLSLLPSCRRSWLLSEGYIASPCDLSPQWSPDSSLSPTLELQDDTPGPGRLPAGLNSPTCLAPPSLDPAAREELSAPEAPVLLLLSRFSQAEDPSRSLVTGPVLQGLLAYAFVRCHAPSLLRAWLVLGVPPEEAAVRPCCAICASRLSRPSGRASSPHAALTGAEADQVACAMALPLICRKKSLCRRLLLEHSGLRLLLAALTRGADRPSPSMPWTRSPCCWELLPPLPAPPVPKRSRLAATPTCHYERLVKAGGVDLHSGWTQATLVPASRQAVCTGSDVLRAMLAGGFAEARQALVPIRGVTPAPFLPVPAPRLQELVEEALCQQYLRPGASLDQLYRLGERLGPRGSCCALCPLRPARGRRGAHQPSGPALTRILQVTGDPKGLAQELLAVAMETPWGVGTDGT
uniref:Armadillo repeat containing 5 n=1 Tax=Gopherus evgoodei TaxID=1825980 RepID=A0A8C4VHF3_9SAUR